MISCYLTPKNCDGRMLDVLVAHILLILAASCTVFVAKYIKKERAWREVGKELPGTTHLMSRKGLR